MLHLISEKIQYLMKTRHASQYLMISSLFYLRGFYCRLSLLQEMHSSLCVFVLPYSQMLISAITERKCNQLDRNILALPVCLGGLGLGNPFLEARHEYASSVKVTRPLVEQTVSQSHQLPEDSLTKLAQQEVRSERLKELEHRAESIKEMEPKKTQRASDLVTEKGSSAWLIVLPLQDLGFNLNKREFHMLNYATTGQWKISPPHVLVGKPLQGAKRSQNWIS